LDVRKELTARIGGRKLQKAFETVNDGDLKEMKVQLLADVKKQEEATESE
jgi:hypothetical protein